MAKIEEVAHVTGQFADIVKLIGTEMLAADAVSVAFQDIIDSAATGPRAPASVRDRFTSPEFQVANLRDWNRRFDLNWSEAQIEDVANDVPEFSDLEPLIPLTLCWTLGSLATTIDAKLEIARYVYGNDKVYITRDFRTDSKHTSVVRGGPAFEPWRLWWQLIDLGANRLKAPNQVPVGTAAGIEIFDVICQHPVYVTQQDGLDTPYLDLPGLSVKIRGIAGPDTPDAAGGPEGDVAVRVRWEGGVHPDFAEPVRET